MKPGAGGTVAFLLYLTALVFWPTAAFSGLSEQLAGRSAADVAYLAMRVIPDLVYDDQPDSLLAWLDAWEKASGAVEPVVCVRILGAIWDGRFNESLYDRRIITQLMDLGSPVTQLAPHADLLATGPAPAEVRRRFDIFRRTFADQLLPHVAVSTPAEFFCLMYSGHRDQAWSLLASEALAGTNLRAYRDRALDQVEYTFPAYWIVSGGYWSPFGKYAFAGDHPLVGVQYGVRRGSWFLQATGELRTGRTTRPYLAREDHALGLSDRFNAALLGLEIGHTVVTRGRVRGGLSAGVGLDSVKPLMDEDFHLDALHWDGGGYLNFDLDRHRQKFLVLTLRREWIRPRNREGTALWGNAWSVRLGLGLNLRYREEEIRRVLRP